MLHDLGGKKPVLPQHSDCVYLFFYLLTTEATVIVYGEDGRIDCAVLPCTMAGGEH